MQIRSRAWLGCLFLLGACGNDGSNATAPPPKVTLAVSSLLPRAGEIWYPGDAEPVLLGCDRRLGVKLDVENFTLRPPGACGGSVQCGYAEVSLLHAADASLAAGPVAAAGTGLVLELGELDPAPGDYLVHPELRTETGASYDRNYAEPPADLGVSLAAEEPCEAGAGGAGNDGAPGAAGVTGG